MTHRMILGVVVSLVAAMACVAQPQGSPRIVDLSAADGTHLKASYFAAGKTGPGVLLLHQCNQQRKNWDDLAGRLSAAGINVLTVDYRGYGESEGTAPYKLTAEEGAKMFREKWPGDVDTAFQYLVSQPDVTRGMMGAGGASCGVNQSIQLARRHPEVKSLVLLSGDTDRDGRQFLKQADKLAIFFSAADDDDGAVELMQWLYGVAANPGDQFAHYATGGHGVDMFAAHTELPGTIVDWFVTSLIKTPGAAPAGKKAAGADAGRASILNLVDEPGGASKVAQKLTEARRLDAKAVLFSEGIVNAIGYEHIQSGDAKGAVEILKLNVTAYPDSANAYDSLSDAYLANGQKDLAKEYAQKALERLASDTTDPEPRRKLIQESAEQKLKQIGEKK